MKNLLKSLTKSKNKTKTKEESELKYWKTRKEKEKKLSNDHYKPFYTENFGLSDEFFQDKKILDIGCGPRGSLEWADMTEERIGLDPLADEYLKLGANEHQMKYVKAYSEDMPFRDNYFDIVCAFNSVDHVEDLDKTCHEIQRVLKPTGTLLLLVDVHDEPTTNEPQIISWDFVKSYFSSLKVLTEEHYEKSENGMYDSIRKKIPFDHGNRQKRYGIISAKLVKTK